LTNPKRIEVARPASTNANIAQHKVAVTSRTKRDVLKQLLKTDNVTSALIFANRKTTVRELAKDLKRAGFSSGEIHGDMDQASRIAELQLFKDGKVNVLVASDVAARGIDVKGVSHVFNYDTPWHPDDYVHRIGRTGRAGATGRAFTLVTPEDAEAIANVEKLTGMKIPVFTVGGNDEQGDRPERADKPEKSDKPEKRGRTREERKPRGDAPREEAPREPSRREAASSDAGPREERAERAPKPEKRRAEPRAERRPEPADDRNDDGGWNGPVPGFLGLSAD
jgi:superfamily II DNA/RNA helicase